MILRVSLLKLGSATTGGIRVEEATAERLGGALFGSLETF